MFHQIHSGTHTPHTTYHIDCDMHIPNFWLDPKLWDSHILCLYCCLYVVHMIMPSLQSSSLHLFSFPQELIWLVSWMKTCVFLLATRPEMALNSDRISFHYSLPLYFCSSTPSLLPPISSPLCSTGALNILQAPLTSGFWLELNKCMY